LAWPGRNVGAEPLKFDQARWEVLTRLEDWLERPMLVLSSIWLNLVIVELT
jgi:voltage-gated potassium channel